MLTIERAYKLRRMIEKASATLTDEDALNTPELFPAWESGKAYAVDERIRYDGELYRVVQTHTSQEDWTPDAVPALFTAVALPDEIPEWTQPLGAHDAYSIGDKVTHNGTVYVSTVDENVWEPGVYGWEVV